MFTVGRTCLSSIGDPEIQSFIFCHFGEKLVSFRVMEHRLTQ